jgi:hypothetical protein
MLTRIKMEHVSTQLRLEFLEYAEDNWKQNFIKLKKDWLNKRKKRKYSFDSNFSSYLRLVRQYGYVYSEWDNPQQVYNVAIRLLAEEVVYNVQPIIDYPVKRRK